MPRNTARSLKGCMSKVSIIVPFYNEESTLPRCLDSILAQSHRDIEVILVDGASVDGSVAICESYAAADRRIRVIRQPLRNGIAAARNEGLRMATGRYVQFIDADDTADPGMTSSLAAVLDPGYCELAVTGYKTSYLGAEGKTTTTHVPEISGDQSREDFVVNCSSHSTRWINFIGVIWNKMFCMDTIRKHALCFYENPEFTAEDLLFSIQYLQHCRRVFTLATASYEYICGTGTQISVNDRYNPRNVRNILLVGDVFEKIFASTLGAAAMGKCRGMLGSTFVACLVNLCRRDATLSRKEILERIAEATSSGMVKGWLACYEPQPGQSRLIPVLAKRDWRLPLFLAARHKGERRYKRFYNPVTVRRGLAWFS